MANSKAINPLTSRYNRLCNLYVLAFLEKQDMVGAEYFWAANLIGGVLLVGDYYFDFNDIRLDIDTKQPPKLIFEWFHECVENIGVTRINYKSYTMGLRKNDLA